MARITPGEITIKVNLVDDNGRRIDLDQLKRASDDLREGLRDRIAIALMQGAMAHRGCISSSDIDYAYHMASQALKIRAE